MYRHPNSLESFLAFGRANLLPRDGEVLAFRQEWAELGGEWEGLVVDRRTLRGEVLCLVRLPWGEAWVRLEGEPGQRVGLKIAPLLRFPRSS